MDRKTEAIDVVKEFLKDIVFFNLVNVMMVTLSLVDLQIMMDI